jgi:pimeloyl-ACP methyl ester carboxylesterase
MSINSYFEVKGRGSPIVFIHGSYATTSTWKKMREQLEAKHLCISIKLPGHCGTPDPEDFSHPTIETELEIIEQVVSKLTDEPVHLVGHSFGGVIALAQALKGNLNLSQLTLFEPVSAWVLDRVQDEKMSARVQDFLVKYRQAVSNKETYVCGQVIDFWGGKGAFDALPIFIKEGMEPLVKNNIRHWNIDSSICSDLSDLKKCTVPTRLVCGSHSNSVAHAICNHLSQQIPNSKKYVLEGASHFLVTSHTTECLQALNDESFF